MADLFQRDVFAAAQQRLRFGQRIHAFIERKSGRCRRGETPPPLPLRHHKIGFFLLTGGGITGDGAFGERQFTAADAGTFPGGINLRLAGLLTMIHRYGTVFYPTPQQHGQLNVRHQSKTAG